MGFIFEQDAIDEIGDRLTELMRKIAQAEIKKVEDSRPTITPEIKRK